jgi:hypothetical protein
MGASSPSPQITALMREIDAVQEHKRKVLATLTPFGRWALDQRLLTGRWPVGLPRAIATVRQRAHAREHRPSGTRRTSSSSRTGSDPPGDDDEPGEAPPAWPVRGLATCPICCDERQTRRRCWFCRGLEVRA